MPSCPWLCRSLACREHHRHASQSARSASCIGPSGALSPRSASPRWRQGPIVLRSTPTGRRTPHRATPGHLARSHSVVETSRPLARHRPRARAKAAMVRTASNVLRRRAPCRRKTDDRLAWLPVGGVQDRMARRRFLRSPTRREGARLLGERPLLQPSSRPPSRPARADLCSMNRFRCRAVASSTGCDGVVATVSLADAHLLLPPTVTSARRCPAPQPTGSTPQLGGRLSRAASSPLDPPLARLTRTAPARTARLLRRRREGWRPP